MVNAYTLTFAVLLLTGEADLYAPPPLQRMIAAHLPKHEMSTLREIGHAPYWEARDVAALRSHLSDCSATTPSSTSSRGPNCSADAL